MRQFNQVGITGKAARGFSLCAFRTSPHIVYWQHKPSHNPQKTFMLARSIVQHRIKKSMAMPDQSCSFSYSAGVDVGLKGSRSFTHDPKGEELLASGEQTDDICYTNTRQRPCVVADLGTGPVFII